MPDSTPRRVLLGAISTGAGRFITVVLGFLCILIYARWVPEGDFGNFVLLQVFLGFLTGFSDLGLSTSVTKFLAGQIEKVKQNEIISNTLFFRFFTLLFFCLLAFFIQEPLKMLFGASLSISMYAYIPFLLLIEGMLVQVNAIIEGQFNFKMLGLSDIIVSTSSFILTIIFIILVPVGVIGLIYARLISRILGLCFGLFTIKVKPTLTLNFRLIWSMLKFGFPLYINYFLSFIFLRADTFIIGILLGPVEIALFEYARKIPESLDMMYTAFRQVYFPVVSRFHAEGNLVRLSATLNQSIRLLTAMTTWGTQISFLFGTWIFLALFSTKYLASTVAFSWLMVGLVLTTIDNTLGYTLVAIGESNKPPMINIFRTFASFIGYFVLIPLLGISGAAIASVLGTAAVNPVNIFFLRKKGVNASIATYLKPILILSVFVAFQLLFFSMHLPVHMAIFMLLAFSGALLLMKVITRDDFTLLRNEIIRLYRHYFNRTPVIPEVPVNRGDNQ